MDEHFFSTGSRKETPWHYHVFSGISGTVVSVKNAEKSVMNSMIGIYATANAIGAEKFNRNTMTGTVACVTVAARRGMNSTIGMVACVSAVGKNGMNNMIGMGVNAIVVERLAIQTIPYQKKPQAAAR